MRCAARIERGNFHVLARGQHVEHRSAFQHQHRRYGGAQIGGLRLAHKGTACRTLPHFHDAAALEQPKRFAQRPARTARVGEHLPLRRESRAGWQAAVDDVAQDLVGELLGGLHRLPRGGDVTGERRYVRGGSLGPLGAARRPRGG